MFTIIKNTLMLKQKIIIILLCFLCLLCSPCLAELPDTDQGRQLFQQGVLLLRQGRYPDAVNEFTKLITIMPDMAGAYKNRGAAYMKLGLYPLAIADFEKTLSLDKDATGLHSNLGVACFYQGEYQKAIDHYNQEIQRSPDSYFAYFNRSICWSNLGNLEKSLADVEKAIDMKPDLYEAVCFKGDLLVEMKQLHQAKSVYKQAMKLDSSQPYARERLAAIDGVKNSDSKIPALSPKAPKKPGKRVKSPRKGTKKKKHKAPPIPSHTIQIYELQTGAYGKRENAKEICETLQDLGYSTRIGTQKMANNKIWYTVRTGKFLSYPEAKKEMERFRKKTGIKALVKKYGTP